MSLLDDAKHKADEAKGKAQTFVGEHDSQFGDAIDRVAGFVDDKTNRRYHERIDGAAHKLKDGVEKFGSKDGEATDQGELPPADQEGPEPA